MLDGIVYAAMLGFTVFPFKATQVMVLGSLATVSGGLSIDFVDFTVLTFAITVFLFSRLYGADEICSAAGYFSLCWQRRYVC